MYGDRGTAAYTNVPAGAGAPGGTANYPASQKVNGTVGGTANYPASNGFGNGYHNKSGVGGAYDSNSANYGNGMKSGGYGGDGGDYVQRTPVSYGPDGRPIVRKSHRMRYAILGALAACCCCVVL